MGLADPGTFSLKVTSNLPLILLVCAVLAAAGFSIWTYYRTLPPAGTWLKTVLALLRTLALTGGIFLLAQPVIEISRHFLDPATVGVLVDRSASMSIDYGDLNRDETVRQLITGDGFKSLRDRFRMKFFAFSDSVVQKDTKADFLFKEAPAGIGTNISRAWMEALQDLAKTPPSALILISDGAHNSGSDPVRVSRTAHVPIWSIGIGSAQKYRDAMILSADVNPVVYSGSVIPVEITYRCVGAIDGSLSVMLKDISGKVVASKRISLKGTSTRGFQDGQVQEGSANFKIKALNTGRQRYTAEISAVRDELTLSNNRRSFYLNVLESKIQTLIMSGPPDFGLGDLIRRLKDDEHIELLQRTTHRRGFLEGSWLSEEALAKIDIVILHHFPVRSTDRSQLRKFAEIIINKEIPVLLVDGGQVYHKYLDVFSEVLPVTINISSDRLAAGGVVPVLRHGIISDPGEVDYTSGWSELPPLKFLPGRFRKAVNGVVLAEFRLNESNDNYPAIVMSESGGVKSLAFLGRDMWRWGLDAADQRDFIAPFLSRIVRWLSIRRTEKQVAIHFDKDIYSNQETVTVAVRVADENFLPLDDAEVTTKIFLNDTLRGEALLESKGNGRYRGSFVPWAEGEYRVDAQAKVDRQLIGKDSGTITVEAFNIELLDAGLHEEILRAIGEFSNGGYLTPAQADSFFRAFDLPAEDKIDTQQIQLWGKGWLLAVIVLLLAAEWFIRIRSGML